MNPRLDEINVVILCGGLGKRLRAVVSDKPKVLAEINSRAFLDILIDSLLNFSFKQIILCVGYQKEKVIKHFAENEIGRHYTLVFSEEETPLGTGGALKKAEPLIESNTFLVMNGDSFCSLDFQKMFVFHLEKRALASLALIESKNVDDFGFVKINEKNEILNFSEKTSKVNNGYINAGVYFCNKEIFSYMPDKQKFSLEYDFFPKIINKGFYGYIIDSKLFDIGTPERYEEAKKISISWRK